MSILRELVSGIGMFQGLLGMLLSGLVVSFAMLRGRGAVRVCGLFMELCGSLVRVTWHGLTSVSVRS